MLYLCTHIYIYIILNKSTYLVDEEVAEDAGARDDHVDAGAAELLEGDELELVHAADGVRHGADAGEGQHLFGGFV